jgi:GAF domain-containing protein
VSEANVNPTPELGESVHAPSDLAAALAQMTQLLLAAQTADQVVDLVLDLAVETLPGTTGAGVTLVDPEGKHTRAASNSLVEEADQLQYLYDAGPCLSAWRDPIPVRIDDMASEVRWPQWTEAVKALGVRSMLSVPMLSAGRSLGAIKVYSDRTDTYDAASTTILELFAKQAAILLSNTKAVADARQLSIELTAALDERDVISQAAGALLAEGATDVPAALTALRSAAKESGHSTIAVAQGIVSALAKRNHAGPS